MNQIIFLVEEALEGGYIARAIGESIFTEGDTLAKLRSKISEAVYCHFDEPKYYDLENTRAHKNVFHR